MKIKFSILAATLLTAAVATPAMAQQGAVNADVGVRAGVNTGTTATPTTRPGLIGGIERAADATGEGIERGARATGRAVKKGARATGRGVRKGVAATGRATSRVGRGISNAAESTGGTGTGTGIDANANVSGDASVR